MINCRSLCKSTIQKCHWCLSTIAECPASMITSNKRLLHISSLQNAGHSHWENVRHIKSAKDHARSQVFSGLSKRIFAAIKEGGNVNDPKKNTELARVLKICKSQNMPRATIEKCLNLKHDTQEHVYGITGPGGSSFVVICQSTSPTTAKNGMLHALKLCGLDGTMEQGRIDDFTRKRVILASISSMDINEDLATEIALDAGAEDVRIISDESGSLLEFICEAKGFVVVEKAIESKDLEIVSSKLEYLPNTLVDLNDHTAIELFVKAMQKVSEKPEILCSITDFFHNINGFHLSLEPH